MKNLHSFSSAEPLCKTWCLDTPPSTAYYCSPLLPQVGTLISPHSSARNFCKTNPFITKQFHPFLDRASTSSLIRVIRSKVFIKSAWQNLPFITWCCLLLLDLLQTSLPRSEPRNCLICYTAIHNFMTLRPVDFIHTSPHSPKILVFGALPSFHPENKAVGLYSSSSCVSIKHSLYLFL